MKKQYPLIWHDVVWQLHFYSLLCTLLVLFMSFVLLFTVFYSKYRHHSTICTNLALQEIILQIVNVILTYWKFAKPLPH